MRKKGIGVHDPLGEIEGVSYSDESQSPCAVMESLRHIIGPVNGSVEIHCKGRKGIDMEAGGLKLTSEGILPITRVGGHYACKISYTEGLKGYERANELLKTAKMSRDYWENFQDSRSGEIAGGNMITLQFLELRLLNAHLGKNEMN